MDNMNIFDKENYEDFEFDTFDDSLNAHCWRRRF
jgi:hypothetical protein